VKEGKCHRCGAAVEIGRTEKMSKSKKNVVDPDELIKSYGADTIRLFCLFASPPEKDLDWSDQGVEGSFRFLARVWRMVASNLEAIQQVSPYQGEDLPDALRNLRRKTHQTIRKVTEDIEERYHFNTGISAIMELVNAVYLFDLQSTDSPFAGAVLREAIETTVLLLSPIAPHIAEELWRMLGNEESITKESWPPYDPEAAREEEMVIVIQVNGKLRSRLTVPVSASEDEIKNLAQHDDKIQEWTKEKTVLKVIYVPKKLVNLVVQ
jgi:leucyl-tRNA synthetase